MPRLLYVSLLGLANLGRPNEPANVHTRFRRGLAEAENPLTYGTEAAQGGHSSVGRALALQARGRRFDPGWLHLRK